MGIVKQYVGYLNIVLAAAAVIIFIILLVRLSKIVKTANIISDDTQLLNRNMQKINDSLDSIRSHEDSWNFFTSVYIITAILKEANRYRKKDHSVPASLSRSVAKHAKQLSSIRF